MKETALDQWNKILEDLVASQIPKTNGRRVHISLTELAKVFSSMRNFEIHKQQVIVDACISNITNTEEEIEALHSKYKTTIFIMFKRRKKLRLSIQAKMAFIEGYKSALKVLVNTAPSLT